MTINKANRGITTGSEKDTKKDSIAARAVVKHDAGGTRPAPRSDNEAVSDTAHVWKGGIDHFGESA